MRKNSIFFNIFLFLYLGYTYNTCNSSSFEVKIDPDSTEQINKNLITLMQSYPVFIKSVSDNTIFWVDSTRMQFDDGKIKSFTEKLENADLEDQMSQYYEKGQPSKVPSQYQDPGRIRDDSFFKKMYGNTSHEVSNNLVEVKWLPKHSGKKIMITRINGVDKKVQLISEELDKHPELLKYVTSIGGTYYWRKIKGTNRLSMHSFGISIDVNVNHSDYWQWNCSCESEDIPVLYKNQIPLEIVKIFEKHGFIWGGKWYHYDTMHFEYRPELLIDK